MLDLRRHDGEHDSLRADFLIDATGMEVGLDGSPLITDVLAATEARRTALGKLAVTPCFEVEGARHDPGRIYASGPLAGGAYGPVDSFLGLQYAALTIADDLAGLGACPRIGMRRSVRQWWRQLRDREP